MRAPLYKMNNVKKVTSWKYHNGLTVINYVREGNLSYNVALVMTSLYRYLNPRFLCNESIYWRKHPVRKMSISNLDYIEGWEYFCQNKNK